MDAAFSGAISYISDASPREVEWRRGVGVGAIGHSRIKLKRAYDAPEKSDGRRILVDRVWPRGVTKEELRLHRWAKDVAPSAELRKWFGHRPPRWEEFKERYRQELDRRPAAIEELAAECRDETVTLVFGAKDVRHNQAVVLKEYLEKRFLAEA